LVIQNSDAWLAFFGFDAGVSASFVLSALTGESTHTQPVRTRPNFNFAVI
jgi:hypothetical protein